MNIDANKIHKACDELDNPGMPTLDAYGTHLDLMVRTLIDHQDTLIVAKLGENDELTLLASDEAGIWRGREDTTRVECLIEQTHHKLVENFEELRRLCPYMEKAQIDALERREKIAVRRGQKYIATIGKAIRTYSSGSITDLALKTLARAHTRAKAVLKEDYTLRRVKAEELDKPAFNDTPLCIGFDNGVVIIDESGYPRLLSPEEGREHLVTVSTGYKWQEPNTEDLTDEDFANPLVLLGDAWRVALEGAFPDEDLAFLRKQMAYIWRGHPSSRMLFMWGEASSGKSTIISGILAAFGNYGMPLQEGIFATRRNAESGDPSMYLIMNPFRLSAGGDVLEGKYLNSSRFKPIISGNDPMTYRKLYSNNYYKGKPTATILVSGNSPPKMNWDDKAVDRRIAILKKDRTFTEEISNLETEILSPEECLSFIHWLLFQPGGVPVTKPEMTESMVEAQEHFKDDARGPLAITLVDIINTKSYPEGHEKHCLPDSKLFSSMLWNAVVREFVPEDKHNGDPSSIKEILIQKQSYNKRQVSELASGIIGWKQEQKPVRNPYNNKSERYWLGASLDESRIDEESPF